MVRFTGVAFYMFASLLQTPFPPMYWGQLSPLTFLTDTSGLNKRSKVISLQESFMPDTSSYARWLGNITGPLTEATICYRVRIFYYRPEVVVFSYINTKGDKIRTGNKIVIVSHQIIFDILFEQFIYKSFTRNCPIFMIWFSDVSKQQVEIAFSYVFSKHKNDNYIRKIS